MTLALFALAANAGVALPVSGASRYSKIGAALSVSAQSPLFFECGVAFLQFSSGGTGSYRLQSFDAELSRSFSPNRWLELRALGGAALMGRAYDEGREWGFAPVVGAEVALRRPLTWGAVGLALVNRDYFGASGVLPVFGLALSMRY